MTKLCWENLSDEEILKFRIKDLNLRLEDSEIYPWLKQAVSELRSKKLLFETRFYLGDEWFSPDGFSAISIPFFLAHPRLRKIEKKMMSECEGEKEYDFFKLIRHELGHAFDHSFSVSRRKLWQRTFGSNKKAYTPEAYRPRPYSKNFVRNISDNYAQSHPDEDFAETFAVWLDPNSDWSSRYKGWGAIKKLQYVDRLCREFQGLRKPMPRGRMLAEARFLNSSLKRYYAKKKKQLEEDRPDFFDIDLMRIFTTTEIASPKEFRADAFLRRRRKVLLNSLSEWTDEKKVVINQLLSQLIQRSKELDLILVRDESQTSMELTAFLATLLSNYRLTGRFKRRV